MKDKWLFKQSPMLWELLHNRKLMENEIALFDKSPFPYRAKICNKKSSVQTYDCLSCTNRKEYDCYKFNNPTKIHQI